MISGDVKLNKRNHIKSLLFRSYEKRILNDGILTKSIVTYKAFNSKDYRL